ncbi:MAG: putative DNA binding domain-containing protein [Blastocatellia bacterium]|nr:putative DNA binding domain-containing protein [Blastocatellia bacterium]
MGKKKVRWLPSSRFEPQTERALYEHMVTRDNYHTLDRREVLDLIRGGEDSEVEFKIRLSNPDKIAMEICAMANSGGGAIFFGVSDTCRVEGLDNADRVEEELREICAHEILPPVHPFMNKVAFDNGRRILVLECDDRRAPHRMRDQRFYIRVGSIKREAEPDEVAELFHRYKPAGFEQIPWFDAAFDDIDEGLVWGYVRALYDGMVKLPDGFPTARVMQDMQLAVYQGKDYTPTMSGLLLFGKSKALEQTLPRSRVVASRFSGDSVTAPLVEQTIFVGNLGNLYERTESFVNRYVDLCETLPQRIVANRGVAERRALYPRKAIWEALTNALVHRDYGAREDWVRVLVFDRRIEIANPAITKGWQRPTVESYGVSIPNNPRLKSFFLNDAYGLKTVRGALPLIRREILRFTGREPKLTISPTEFRIELPGA